MHVLLVEDNLADRDLTRECFEQARVRAQLHSVDDGVEAMRFLRRANGFRDVPRPDLVLLDLNLPGMDGRSVLRELKGDAQLATIPVLILSSSAAESDVNHSYALHANAYVVKPTELDEFLELVDTIDRFWLRTVRRPTA